MAIVTQVKTFTLSKCRNRKEAKRVLASILRGQDKVLSLKSSGNSLFVAEIQETVAEVNTNE